jgi:lipooligosaccharide transport system permease protein
MSQATALLRVLPIRLGSRRAVHLIERNVYLYRRTWMILFSGFFEPLFYLLSIGLGIGGMIGDVTGPNGESISYALFVAPALLATASMNGAIAESTFNVFFKLNYQKTYDAVLATPLGPGDVALGEIGWAVIRGALYAIGFVVVIVVLGLVASPWVAFAVPAATLLAFAFAAVGMAATTFMRSWQDFDLIQLVILPLFLFSGTFFPISAYPPSLQLIVQLTPLYQGVHLIRGLVTGYVDPSLLLNVAYLAARASSGWWSSPGGWTGSCSVRAASSPERCSWSRDPLQAARPAREGAPPFPACSPGTAVHRGRRRPVAVVSGTGWSDGLPVSDYRTRSRRRPQCRARGTTTPPDPMSSSRPDSMAGT